MLKRKIIPVVASLSAAALATVTDSGTRVENDLSQCRAGASGTAVLVRVIGFRDSNGRVRVQSYGSDESWLERGQWLHRVDIPVQPRGRNMTVCLPLPGPGIYGIAVRHDANGNRRSDRRDGGGFSGNPDLSFPFNLEPDFDEVSFRAGNGVTRISVVLNYMQGTSVEPVG